MKKLKVLHLLRSNRFSGAENVVFQIIDMFKNDNIEMAYCSRDGQIRESLKERNINFLPISQLSVREVKRVIRDYEPDVIHAHDPYASFIAAIAGGKHKIISHMHGNHEDLSRLCFKSLLYLLSTKRFNHIFWVSNSAYDNYYFKEYINSKSSILYNIINRDSLIKKMNEDLNVYNYDVVYIGRLTYPKNPERLIKVLKLAIEINPNITVAIVGTGDLLEQTKKLTVKLGVSNNIAFLGFKSNPLKILHDAKVMLMTSRFEGTPMCALEAMALGVPIVSLPTDGLMELVDNEVTGYLSDDNKVLAQKVVEIISDKKLYDYLSKESIKRFKQLNNLEKYKSDLERVYNG